MKILHIISNGYEGGGAEVYLMLLKNKFEENNNEVKILSSDINNEVKHFSNYEFKNIKLNKNIFRIIFHLFNPYSYFKLKKILNEYNPDLVHLHTMPLVSPSVLFLLKRYPTVLTIHGPEEFIKSMIVWSLPPNRFKNRDYKTFNLLGFMHYYFLYYIQRTIYKVGLKNVDLFIAPSNFMKRQISMEYKNVYLLYNGMALKGALKPVRGKKLIFVGGLKKFKGVMYLIKAMQRIIDKIPDASLDIVGDGDDKDELIKLVNDLKLQDKIKFLGWVNNKNIRNIYKNANIVVIPSICPENLPTVCIEAMDVGRPLIGTNIGGIPELIENGKTGFLVDPGNSDQIAEKVIQLFSDRKLLEQMGENGRKKAEQFDIKKHVKEIEEVYQEVINKYKNNK